jgi:hypothetical protein
VIKRCKTSFAASVGGGVPRVIKAGALVQDDDPIIKGREHLFEDVDTFVQKRRARVEAATAEPGAQRSLSKPAKKTAAAKTAAPRKPAPKDVGSGEGGA